MALGVSHRGWIQRNPQGPAGRHNARLGVDREPHCAGLSGLSKSVLSIPVADATGKHCASPPGFIATSRRNRYSKAGEISLDDSDRVHWPSTAMVRCTAVGESSLFLSSGPSRRRGDHRRSSQKVIPPSSMNLFYILAHGHSFDVERFIGSSTLIPSLTWNVGQRSHGMVRADTDGFIIYLTEEALGYQAQQTIAVEFIRKNQEELRRCCNFPGVDYFLLSLHVVLPLTDSTFGFGANANMDLLEACVGVGLNPTIFVEFDRGTGDSNLLDTNQGNAE
ncbi:hypothetical protein Enr13x_19040 [Stieleria neptunia]|uniref:DUF4279 domain-containing protein n=1 Tax=Stieleria neptunia TaxID=2527979 RepID=A0A518HMH7_9BACT|nr:hypothetical protein Enr13x_19040 [Stieleria neptunia]